MGTTSAINQRRYERFALEPMYTEVIVQRVCDNKMQKLSGHLYDISEVGARIELDEPLAPGEPIGLQINLPGNDETVHASGVVIWCHDGEDDPGPRRMAVRFTRFLAVDDRDRLIRYLGHGMIRRAA